MDTIIRKAKKRFFPRPEKEKLPDFLVAEIKEMIVRNSKPVSSSTLIEDVRFAVMDLETTGFNSARGHEIIAIGAVLIEGNKLQREKTFHELVYPDREVPDHILKLTGIQREMLVGRLSFFGVLLQFLEFIGSSVIVGHNIDFDMSFINPKLKKYCGTKVKNRTIDTMALAKSLHVPVKSYSLDNLLAFYGIEQTGRHSALGDSLMTAELLIRLLAVLKEIDIHTLGGLDEFMKRHTRFDDDKIF
jgi:DNA polymerase-3 subunit epsilon